MCDVYKNVIETELSETDSKEIEFYDLYWLFLKKNNIVL